MASSLDDIIRGRLDLSENMDEQESEELVDYEPDSDENNKNPSPPSSSSSSHNSDEENQREVPGPVRAEQSRHDIDFDAINGIEDINARKIAMQQFIRVQKLSERNKAMRQAPIPNAHLEARKPAIFDGKDKNLKFKTWAQSTKHYLSLKGQSEDTFVKSAVSWLSGLPQSQAMLLLEEGPSEAWDYDGWVEAMQKALYQTDPTYEARLFLHTAHLDTDRNYAAFANKFQQNLAILQASDESERMCSFDQTFLFRKAIRGTCFYQETEVDQQIRHLHH